MSDLHKNFFDCATRNIEKRVKKKLKDNNTLKSDMATPHHRKVTSHVPKLSFMWVYGRQFDASTEKCQGTKGKNTKESTAIFCLKSLKRVVTILSTEAIIK